MPGCSIINCSNTSKEGGAVKQCISYHCFPKDPSLKNKWIEATGRKKWFPTKNSRICSAHFHEDTFSGSSKYRRLINTAYPTIDIVIMSTDEKPQDDLKNYMQHKLLKDEPKLKPTAVLRNVTSILVTAISDTDTARRAEDESDNEIEEEMEVWAGSDRVLACAECGRAADCGGKLYQCVECPRVVCAACEREERHRQHCLLRLPSRAVYEKLRVLYESLRETVTAHLCDDDELVVPKEETVPEEDPLNITSNEEIIQQLPNNYTKQVGTDNTKRLLLETPSLVKTEPELELPGAKSVPATLYVPVTKSVPAPKIIHQARVTKPKPAPEEISDGRPLMLNVPGDHGHSYTVISTGAAKWTGKTKPSSSTERCESTTTAKRKKPESQKDDEEPVYMDVEYLTMNEKY